MTAHAILTKAASDEPMYEDEEVTEYYDPEVVEEDEDGENRPQDGEDMDNVVVSGDPSAAANALKGGEKLLKDKKIPEGERTTTPYMTKYERARILGTRALQIRFAFLERDASRPGWLTVRQHECARAC